MLQLEFGTALGYNGKLGIGGLYLCGLDYGIVDVVEIWIQLTCSAVQVADLAFECKRTEINS